jgi:hypothetical protein
MSGDGSNGVTWASDDTRPSGGDLDIELDVVVIDSSSVSSSSPASFVADGASTNTAANRFMRVSNSGAIRPSTFLHSTMKTSRTSSGFLLNDLVSAKAAKILIFLIPMYIIALVAMVTMSL